MWITWGVTFRHVEEGKQRGLGLMGGIDTRCLI